MGLRQSINERPVATAVVSGLIVAAALAWNIWLFGHGTPDMPKMPDSDKAFFSDNDGKTWFVDAASKIPPINHNGRPAYRAELFRCGKDKVFVAYLARFSEEGRRQMEAEIKKGRSASDVYHAARADMEVKAPGKPAWLNLRANTEQFMALTGPICADGSPAQHLRPEDLPQ